MKKQQRILSDHTKQGKKLVPPLLAIKGNHRDTSYVNLIIPEIIWIALLIESYGVSRGTAIGLEVVQTTSKVAKSSSLLFSFISSFESLNQLEKQTIIKDLDKLNVLTSLRDGLQNFIAIYPECPLRFLFDEPVPIHYDINRIKEILITLYDKVGITSTFAMGNVIYYMGVVGMLQIDSSSSLSKLPKLAEYPDTLLSKMIASSVRAAMNTLMHPPFYNSSNKWNKYFWNRGHELEPSII